MKDFAETFGSNNGAIPAMKPSQKNLTSARLLALQRLKLQLVIELKCHRMCGLSKSFLKDNIIRLFSPCTLKVRPDHNSCSAIGVQLNCETRSRCISSQREMKDVFLIYLISTSQQIYGFKSVFIRDELHFHTFYFNKCRRGILCKDWVSLICWLNS